MNTHMMATDETTRTVTGRTTTPFPRVNVSSDRKAKNTLKRIDVWLQSNAISEAQSRHDDYNELQFTGETAGKIPPASRSAMYEYLFGLPDDY